MSGNLNTPTSSRVWLWDSVLSQKLKNVVMVAPLWATISDMTFKSILVDKITSRSFIRLVNQVCTCDDNISHQCPCPCIATRGILTSCTTLLSGLPSNLKKLTPSLMILSARSTLSPSGSNNGLFIITLSIFSAVRWVGSTFFRAFMVPEIMILSLSSSCFTDALVSWPYEGAIPMWR